MPGTQRNWVKIWSDLMRKYERQAEQETTCPAKAATKMVYVSDFGVLDVVPNRFMRQVSSDYTDVFVLDTEYLEVRYLQGYTPETIAKIGDAERRHILVDYALCVKNPAAHGVYADVNDDTAMTA